jgi:hypothetical protein
VMQQKSNKFSASFNVEEGNRTGAVEPLTEGSEHVSARSLLCEEWYLPKPTRNCVESSAPITK